MVVKLALIQSGSHVVAELLDHTYIKTTFGYGHLAEGSVFDTAKPGSHAVLGIPLLPTLVKFATEYVGRRELQS